MGYQKADGSWARTAPVTVQASATKTSNFSGAAVEIGDRGVARLDLVVSAASGTTPTLDVSIETSADGSTGWTAIASFAQQTTTTAGVHKVFSGVDRFVRAVATIGGTTPSFTYAVSGEAV